MKSLNLGFGFLTRADLLSGTSGVVEDSTTKDGPLLETHVEVCSATPVVVVPSVVDLAVTRSGAAGQIPKASSIQSVEILQAIHRAEK